MNRGQPARFEGRHRRLLPVGGRRLSCSAAEIGVEFLYQTMKAIFPRRLPLSRRVIRAISFVDTPFLRLLRLGRSLPRMSPENLFGSRMKESRVFRLSCEAPGFDTARLRREHREVLLSAFVSSVFGRETCLPNLRFNLRESVTRSFNQSLERRGGNKTLK